MIRSLNKSCKFAVFGLPKLYFKNNQFINESCRLKEVAEKINRYGFVTPPALSGLKASVKRIVVGPTHIALLMDDNRICRVAFTVLSDRLDLSKNEPNRKYVKRYKTKPKFSTLF